MSEIKFCTKDKNTVGAGCSVSNSGEAMVAPNKIIKYGAAPTTQILADKNKIRFA